ncbi:MAG: RagB/SusD family nutrient uptake outer membrane protein [Bacteroidales bacterium]|nr:RagB/SusD family nutrient uptake outer membrane protein [Bacteroidales bacterium]MDD3521331.1 RagB/SusD family nutrient uptake outer membrane protein [Bacteroidales bacterium]MDD4030605.1 RagB/SusD family nutrient uptake outer membrane protein [Bacteroidales bacterium]MDD4434706.1 RagB/SusD family nutrient uptake outer membrane protein [Bacteroidales bacterium]MDD5732182.1 RagB/SusD family nutrient uptake outer membrane protein [Bacteroidales bacterium]
MKKILYILTAAIMFSLSNSCADLDLNPLSEASSENWYSDPAELVISLNDFYRDYLWEMECGFWTDRRTDDWNQRDYIYELANGSAVSTWSYNSYWENTYKGISRANRLEESVENLREKYSDSELNPLLAEALFFRAYLYSRLVTLYGDVPFYTDYLSIEEAFKMGRVPKDIIIKQIYQDFDYAIENLPEDNNSGSVTRVNKGAALALKARWALQFGDYQTALSAAQACINLGKYSLYPDYGAFFRDKTMNSETIFTIPHSSSLELTSAGKPNVQSIRSFTLRTAGGTATAQPSWELLAAFDCIDGLPIDESPLFDPHDPYKNRDPRCNETFVAPGTVVYGFVFDPSPGTIYVLNVGTGAMVKNKDNKVNDQYAAYNSTCLKKGAQDDWVTTYNDNPNVIIRYADVLLIYAEAKIELNQIDASVLNAINDVRARAYGVSRGQVSAYPEVTGNNQAELRRQLRKERRVEFAWEGRRYFDLLRWGWLEKAYSHNMYGHLNQEGIKSYYAAGHWYWPEAPEIDEDGFANFAPMFEKGYIMQYGERKFDPKSYMWPIPNTDILINPNITQNAGY